MAPLPLTSGRGLSLMCLAALLAGCSVESAPESKLLSEIVVSTLTPEVSLGRTARFSALGKYSDGSTALLTAEVEWESAQPSVATVSNERGSQGLVTTVSAGTSEIRAHHDGVTGSATLTVTGKTVQ